MVVQYIIYSPLILSKFSKSHFVVRTQSVLHKIIAVTYEQMSQKGMENMKVPNLLICAYNNDILFSNYFGLAEGIF